MKLSHLRCVSVLALGILAGCGSTRKGPGAGDPISATGGLAGDPEMESQLETLELRTVGEGSDRRLEFTLRNKSSRRQTFAWALEWYDRSDTCIGAASTSWTPMTLDAGAVRQVKVPMPPEARSSRLRAIRA